MLAAMLWIFHPSTRLELPLVHLCNFIIFLLALLAFEYLWSALDGLRKSNVRSGDFVLPQWAWASFGYLLFLFTGLYLIDIRLSTGDLLASAMVYFACGALTRIQIEQKSAATFVVLGGSLGLGYLAKAFLFPWSIVVFVVALIVAYRHSAVKKIVLSILAFSIFAAPFILLLSRYKGQFTFSEVGKYNYLVFVDGAPAVYWEGLPPGTGIPKHPPRQIWDKPPAFDIASNHLGGTYPLWFDPGYWYDGMTPHFEWRAQVRTLLRSAKYIVRLFTFQTAGIVGVLTLILLGDGRRVGKAIVARWYLIGPSLAALAAYSLILFDYRYVGPFILVVCLSVISCLYFRASFISRHAVNRVCSATLAACAINSALLIVPYSGQTYSATDTQFALADELGRLGIPPGTRVGIVGSYKNAPNWRSVSYPYWARLDRLRVVAEVAPSSPGEFWNSDLETQERVLKYVCRSTGAALLITEDAPLAVGQRWRKMGDTRFYVWRPDAATSN